MIIFDFKVYGKSCQFIAIDEAIQTTAFDASNASGDLTSTLVGVNLLEQVGS